MDKNKLARTTKDINKLKELSEDTDWYIRYLVAQNINVPEDVLTKLSEDERWEVRYGVIFNKKTSAKILTKLTKDRIHTVSIEAKETLKNKRVWIRIN